MLPINSVKIKIALLFLHRQPKLLARIEQTLIGTLLDPSGQIRTDPDSESTSPEFFPSDSDGYRSRINPTPENGIYPSLVVIKSVCYMISWIVLYNNDIFFFV